MKHLHYLQVALLLLLCAISMAQGGHQSAASIDFANELKSSVVPLELKLEDHDEQLIKRRFSIMDSAARNLMDKDSANKRLSEIGKVRIRPIGSSLFLYYRGMRYLVTSKRVIEYHGSIQSYQHAPIRMVLRIPGTGETDNIEVPLNFDVASGRKGAWEFSNDEADLAVISLDSKQKVDALKNTAENHSAFADFLEQKGHVPMSIDFADTTGYVNAGTEVIMLGIYPSGYKQDLNDFKTLNKAIHRATVAWKTGKVTASDSASRLFYLYVDENTAKHGGPVVDDGKVTGFVTSVATSDTLHQPAFRADSTPLNTQARTASAYHFLKLINMIRSRLKED